MRKNSQPKSPNKVKKERAYIGGYISKALYDEFKKFAESQKRSTSNMIDIALDEFLKLAKSGVLTTPTPVVHHTHD